MSDTNTELSHESRGILEKLDKILQGKLRVKMLGICYNMEYQHSEAFVTYMSVGWKGQTEPTADPMRLKGYPYPTTETAREYQRWQEPQRSLRLDLTAHLRKRTAAGDWDHYLKTGEWNERN